MISRHRARSYGACPGGPPASRLPRRSACLALAMGALVVVPVGPALAQSAPPPPSVTVSAPLQKEIVEWDEFTGQFAAGRLCRDPRPGQRLPDRDPFPGRADRQARATCCS